MEYIGHTSDDGRKQLLLDHLNGTSKLCRENANEFWADIAEFVGQIHDIGKYTSGFQKRINGAEISEWNTQYAVQKKLRKHRRNHMCL